GRLANVHDSKLDEFLEVVENIRSTEPETKIVVFTGFKATQKYLADNLGRRGFAVSKFHGGLSLEDKERAIREFRDSSQILISTEAGGEGRNLQVASVLINYDLPWNPMKVEQRIGRLDRIGQKKRVRILNLFRYETVEERVHAVLNDRIRLFEESVGSLDAILGDLETEIENLFMAGDHENVAALEQSIEAQVAEARETERVMADLALDRSSFRRDQTNDLLGKEPLATHSDLRCFVSDALEHFGGTLQKHEDGGEVISLSPRLATQLELPSGQQHGVFDPQVALEREDLDFFALGNHWVDAVVEHAGNENRSTATVYSVPGGPALPQLEIIYEFRSSGRNPRGEVIVHRVGQELEVAESLLRKMPVFGQSVRLECPDWLREATSTSQARMRERLATFSEEVRKADEALREEDLKRNERITVYRRQRFVDRIEEHLAWIAQVEASGTDNQKKILPARKGRLKKDQDRLDRIDTESERERQKILSQASVPSSTTWSAALVVGQ
ncbi:MAG TPA: helicase-related protein, partial [Candidatus Latescibacteria bacterium]|nr:helicase-related protein [Candidatus Latescibacterota bacterium]